MKTFAILGPKGGTGKSLTTTVLAVRAAQETGRVGVIDLNEDQGTLSEWWVLRGRPVNPYLHDDEGTLDALIEGLQATDWTYCFIDGPPYEQDLIEMSVIVADVVLVPVKLAYFDASTIDSIVGLCRKHSKPFAFVINEFDGRKIFAKANALPLEMLRERGPILKTRISYDPRYRIAQVKGQTGAELDKALAQEIDALWTEAKSLAGVGPNLKSVEGGRGR